MKKVFLTGGSGDIGSAIKREFEQNNYVVLSPGRDELNLQNRLSISEYTSCNKHILKDINILVYCAGYNNPKPIYAGCIDKTDEKLTMQVNYFSFVELVQNLIPNMKKNKSGKILSISSLFSIITKEGRSAYTARKHALNGFIKTLAVEEGRNGIIANSLSPGFIDTQMTRKNNTEESIKKTANKIPLQRLGTPEEIAKVAYFLCSENNTYITGQNIVCDGGILINA